MKNQAFSAGANIAITLLNGDEEVSFIRLVLEEKDNRNSVQLLTYSALSL